MDGIALWLFRVMSTSWRAIFILALAASCGGPVDLDEGSRSAQDSFAATVSATIVARRADWWVWPNADDPGICWMHGCWSDVGWTNATAPLGYGETYVNPIPYGSDPDHKPITVYFRRDFFVEDPARVAALRLDVMFDDGFVYYINGNEIGRGSMPAGTVTPSTLAIGHEANNAYASFNAATGVMVLRAGWNTLAVEVHQVSPSSSDLVFDASLVAEMQTAPPPAMAPTRGGIPRHALWSYWDRGGDLGNNWMYGGSVDGWAQGAGPLGYGESYLSSTIGSGPDASNKYITTYFRKKFWVSDPSFVTALRAELMFDDGVVIYLNNQRLTSYSMPAGTTNASTLASSHEASNAYQVLDWTAFKGMLQYGENTIAVEVHQSSPSSSDLVFDLALGVQTMAVRRIARSSPWSYWDRGGDLGSAWRNLAFDDSAWPTGEGPLGYGETYVGALVSYGPSASNKYVTTYFRKKLRIDDASLVRSLRAELMWDDGAVIYLNGREIARTSMPAGAISASTLATGHEADNAYTAFDWSASRGLLVNGDNEIAVEVHQSSPSSSDLVFDLSLQVLSEPVFTKYAGNPVVTHSGDETPPLWRQETVYDPKVIHMPDGSWLMYYTANDGLGPHYQVGRATSSDGVHWIQDTDPLWGIVGIAESVTYDGTLFRMWTSDYHDVGIRLATSTDGVSWTRPSEGNPVIADGRTVTVIFDGSRHEMWFVADGGSGYATSSDGVTWTRSSSPLVGDVPATVVKEGGIYKGWSNAQGFRDIAYMTSPDGLSWTPRNLSLSEGPSGAWDHSTCNYPFVLRDGATLKMWFSGAAFPSSGYQIGYATSP